MHTRVGNFNSKAGMRNIKIISFGNRAIFASIMNLNVEISHFDWNLRHRRTNNGEPWRTRAYFNTVAPRKYTRVHVHSKQRGYRRNSAHGRGVLWTNQTDKLQWSCATLWESKELHNIRENFQYITLCALDSKIIIICDRAARSTQTREGQTWFHILQQETELLKPNYATVSISAQGVLNQSETQKYPAVVWSSSSRTNRNGRRQRVSIRICGVAKL